MIEDLVPLVVGFTLTTVLGGLLGTYLQKRSWNHQNEARLNEEELRRADEVSRSISELLDKRLYRMLRLFYSLQALGTAFGSASLVEQRLQDYTAVLYEWNDRLNLNLALIGTYFGEAARDWLDAEVYESFQHVGSELEELYRQSKRASEPPSIANGVESDLLKLNDQVYRLGVFMMTQLRGGYVGRLAPYPVVRYDSPASVPGTGVPLADIPAKPHDDHR